MATTDEETLTRLPDEILFKIFAFLKTTDILGGLGGVSRRIRHVGLSCVDRISITKCVSMVIRRGWKIPRENDLRGLLDICPRVRKLDLSGTKNNVPLALHAINNCSMLEELIGIDFEDSPAPEHLFQCYASTSSSLKRIRIHNLVMTSNWTSLLSSKLNHLEMVECRSLNDEILTDIGRRCPNLETLDCGLIHHFCTVSDVGLGQFLASFGRSLRKIEFYGECLTDAAFVSLGNCRDLERVRIYNPRRIGLSGLTALLGLPKLREISLMFVSKMLLSPGDYVMAFSGKASERLEVLEMAGMSINDNGLRAIARRCPRLKRVWMSTKQGLVTRLGVRDFVSRCGDGLILFTLDGKREVDRDRGKKIARITPVNRAVVVDYVA